MVSSSIMRRWPKEMSRAPAEALAQAGACQSFSWRRVQNLFESGRRVRADNELFEHAGAHAFLVGADQPCSTECLHMQEPRIVLVDGREIIGVVAQRILALVV